LYHTNTWEGFRDLLTQLPGELVETALHLGSQLFLDRRCEAIRALAPRLPDRLLPGLITELEAEQRGTDNELKERARALIALATRITVDEERQRILAVVLNYVVKRRWWTLLEPVFVDLIPLLPPSSRSEAVAAAVRQCFAQYHVGDLRLFLDVLEGSELELVFAELDRIRDPHERATVRIAVLRRAGALADRSKVFQNIDVFAGWPPSATRAELFALTGASAWWIHRLGGDQAVAATADAVFDVCHWWR
jgi:hypothetical protein